KLARRLLAQHIFGLVGDHEKCRIRLAAAHLANLGEARAQTLREQTLQPCGVEAMRLPHRNDFRQRLLAMIAVTRHGACGSRWRDICAIPASRWFRDEPRQDHRPGAAPAYAP